VHLVMYIISERNILFIKKSTLNCVSLNLAISIVLLDVSDYKCI
jgi:hypothetical protein